MTGAVLMGGCGTSGRLAMMACTKFNLAAARSGAVGNSPPFRCLLAGGDRYGDDINMTIGICVQFHCILTRR